MPATARMFTDAASTHESATARALRIAGEEAYNRGLAARIEAQRLAPRRRVEYHGVLVTQQADGSWRAVNVVSVIEEAA